MKLDAATLLLQWSTGGLFFCWATTWRREVGVGYGWLLRSTYLVIAAGGVFVGRVFVADGSAALVRDLFGAGVVAACGAALAVSIARRKTGEFPPVLDLVAPVMGLGGLIAASVSVGGPEPLALARLVAGAAFLGGTTDAMLLGHWYLVQPKLGREPIKSLLKLVAWTWPVEVAVLCWPTGMFQVFTGAVDDGWNGVLGLIWAVSALSTIALIGTTWLALRERSYSAVMAATGLLYLAILTAFGTDLIARAVLVP